MPSFAQVSVAVALVLGLLIAGCIEGGESFADDDWIPESVHVWRDVSSLHVVFEVPVSEAPDRAETVDGERMVEVRIEAPVSDPSFLVGAAISSLDMQQGFHAVRSDLFRSVAMDGTHESVDVLGLATDVDAQVPFDGSVLAYPLSDRRGSAVRWDGESFAQANLVPHGIEGNVEVVAGHIMVLVVGPPRGVEVELTVRGVEVAFLVDEGPAILETLTLADFEGGSHVEVGAVRMAEDKVATRTTLPGMLGWVHMGHDVSMTEVGDEEKSDYEVFPPGQPSVRFGHSGGAQGVTGGAWTMQIHDIDDENGLDDWVALVASVPMARLDYS